MSEVTGYIPPPTVASFIGDYLPGKLFYNYIVGPYGSGKSTGLFMKLAYMAGLQAKGKDGIRRSRCVVVRNTASQLRDTTLRTFFTWFKDGQAGTWRATDKEFIMRFGDVECEVLFRPLDTPDDISRVLSLEVTFAIVDEFVQIPREIIEALSGRCGRFPSRKDGGATNYGMWGASNPDTEDNWWYDLLHGNGDSFGEVELVDPRSGPLQQTSIRYYHQPGGMSANAENLEWLIGGPEYYTNLRKGKSKEWIKQFIDAEWGYTASGKPVLPSFNPTLHISKTPLRYNPYLPLVIGLDPGITGSAMILGQEDASGRLLVLGELVQSGFGAERMITERLKPYLRRRFPNAEIVIAPDPAADNRAQTDERSVVDVFRKHFPGRVRVETNNRLAKRLDAMENYTTRLTDAGPALLIDEAECPVLVRALRGGWRYEQVVKTGELKTEPEKNQYSHPGDAFGYLCRYFHKTFERYGTRGTSIAGLRNGPPVSNGVRYTFA